jgi:hypothetical protein
MGQEEGTSSSKGTALTCDERKKMKGKQVESSSSSSSSSEDEEEDEDDHEESSDAQASTSSNIDEDTIKVRENVVKNIHKLNVKGVPIQIEDCLSPTKEESKETKGAMDAAREGILWKIVQTSPHPRTRRQEKQKAKPSQQSRLRMVHRDDEAQHKRRSDKSSSSSSHICLMA